MNNYTSIQKFACFFILFACILTLRGFAMKESRPHPSQIDTIPQPNVPVYKKLKNLYLYTVLVTKGKPTIIIVAPKDYATEAVAIQSAIKRLTGATIQITQTYPEYRAFPLESNLILLGNRSTNNVISTLYDRGYTYLDMKYPGQGGFVVRTLHNPYGNGKNVIFAGGSDAAGVKEASENLIKLLNESISSKDSLSVGYLCKIKLGKDYAVPDSAKDAEIWEASRKYGSSGYFGWNTISKNMALYYMTNNKKYLQEFLRLAFPDKLAIKEMEKTDGELIENKSDPLAGPYHYAASNMIQLWDLIEESPALTDSQRLKITNAFARQLLHRVDEYGSVYWSTKPPLFTGDRHFDWAAFSLYALGRYFEKDYPNPVWKRCMAAGDLYFSALKKTSWIAGNNDHLFWFTSFYDPILDYLIFTGNRGPVMLANLRQMLNTQEILFTGAVKDEGLESSSLTMLNKAAYILNDGRWVYYRKHVGLNTDIFRLGQSFWPGPELKPKVPVDLSGKWKIQWMPKAMWAGRATGFPAKQSFRWGSYRSEAGSGGDYIQIKGYNGAGRNPYHTFDILELRLNGATLLTGYHNQVLTSIDGMVEPKVAMDAALLYSGVVGQVAIAVAKVPDLAFAKWQRSLALRKGRYVLIADDLHFGINSNNILVETTWEMSEAMWMPQQNFVKIQPKEKPQAAYELHSSELMEVHDGKDSGMNWRANNGNKVEMANSKEETTTMNWHGGVQKGQNQVFFHLFAKNTSGTNNALACLKLADNAASLALPEAGIAVAGKYQNLQGDLVVLSEKSLFGHNISLAGLTQSLLVSDLPIEVDWDFANGKLEIINNCSFTLSLALASPWLKVNGKAIKGKAIKGLFSFHLTKGQQEITGAYPSSELKKTVTTELTNILEKASELRIKQVAKNNIIPNKAIVPALTSVMHANIGGVPISSIIIPSPQGDLLGVATGHTITLLNSGGREMQKLTTPGEIRVLRWWAEPKLLLVGCTDEKVIAFDEQGYKKWEFTSEMDSAVYETGKQYWFKSAFPGIYGLYSGYFDNGKSRAFVGSACTLEILDENGQLVKRLPVFWSVIRQFLMTTAKDGSKNLLVGGWLNGFNQLVAIGSKKIEEVARGYDEFPPGHSSVKGFAVMNRYDNFLTDLNHDGRQEVISAINGSWNRVSIYSEDGKPLFNAQFGPGSSTPRSTMRMMDVGDLSGDGKPEIIVGIASGKIVVLNGQAQKLWAIELSSPPTVVKLVKDRDKKWVYVGSEDGTIVEMDGQGNILKQGKVTGRPLDIQVLKEPNRVVVIIDDQGKINGFTLD